MKTHPVLRALWFVTLLASAHLVHAQAQTAVDMGSKVPDAAAVKEGLFPEEACKELEASGMKCMGVKPAIRYSLPASAFSLGSTVLPGLLKRQLDVFASVLQGKRAPDRKVRVIGHADASGTSAANISLSLRRAEVVKSYLVQKGADPGMLQVEGVGAKQLKNPANPKAAENRRVEIGRQVVAATQ
jgi:OmpA-OmpF porin, OOP family